MTEADSNIQKAVVLLSKIGGRSSGFALLIVLWTLVLIALIVVHITTEGRTEIRIANNVVAAGVTHAAADGAMFEAIFNQSDPRPNERWPVDGNPRDLFIGHSRITLRLEDEAWRINPNLAPPALLEALLRATGTDRESARRLALSIGEWVGSAPAPRPSNVLLADYRAAGLDYGPPGAPLESLDELGRVLGMTPTILAALRPHLTLFGPPQPSLASPDPVVMAAVARAGITEPVVAANQPPPDIHTTRILAVASGPNNAEVTRSAVIRFGAALPAGYEVLVWGDRM